jgi:hypothetical protein
MSDCIKVVDRNGSTEWSLNLPKIYFKDSDKNFLFADELINSKLMYEKVLFHNQPLVYSSQVKNVPKAGISILDKLLPFGLIVDQSVSLVEGKSNINFFDYEFFCFDSLSWIVAEEPTMQSQFYRIRGTFVGFSYYVYVGEAKLTYKILNNEWALLIAIFLLNRSMRNIFVKTGKNMKIRISTKIPYVLLQHIFLNAENMFIEYDYEFTNVKEIEMDSLFEYLMSR